MNHNTLLYHCGSSVYRSLPAPHLCSQQKTTQRRLKPREWNTYIHAIFRCPGRPATPRPITTHPPGAGLLATLADWVSRVKMGSGTERRNQITPIDHLLPALLWEPRSHGHKIKALPSRLWPARYTDKGSWERQTQALFGWSHIPYRTLPCNAATTHSHKRCDCNWRAARDSGGQARTDKSSMSRKGPVVTFYKRRRGYIWDH